MLRARDNCQYNCFFPFSYFKSLFSFTKLYCVSFRFVCFVLFRLVSFRLFSLKWHFRETRNFAKIIFFFAKLRNSFRFCFAKISRNEIPLKTLATTRYLYIASIYLAICNKELFLNEIFCCIIIKALYFNIWYAEKNIDYYWYMHLLQKRQDQ